MPNKAKRNTLDAVIEGIIKELTQETRFLLASLDEDKLEICKNVMRVVIRSRFVDTDEAIKAILMADCFAKSDHESLDEADVVNAIFQGILEKLKDTHRSKIVKYKLGRLYLLVIPFTSSKYLLSYQACGIQDTFLTAIIHMTQHSRTQRARHAIPEHHPSVHNIKHITACTHNPPGIIHPRSTHTTTTHPAVTSHTQRIIIYHAC